MSTKVRIEAPGPTGFNTRVIFIDPDGNETDISNVCRALHFDVTTDDPNVATVELIKVAGSAEAELVDVVVEHVRPRPWWRRRLRNVTGLGHNADRWIHA